MKKIILFIFFYSQFFNFLYSQEIRYTIDISKFSDCNNALLIKTDSIFGPTTAPLNHGKILEFKDNPKNSIHYFEKEHHSVWYKFEAEQTGELILEIHPLNKIDDYDFLLFTYTDTSFCNNVILKKRMLPDRTNISRPNPKLESVTGLSFTEKEEWISSGIGRAYSRAMNVKKGSMYYLVLDDVYGKGNGHYLKFEYKIISALQGKITDEITQKGLKAEINIVNSDTQENIALLNTLEDGRFYKEINIEVAIKSFDLLIFAKNYVFKDTTIFIENTENIINVNLKKLKKGENFTLKNINFYGSMSDIIPQCKPNLYKLLKFMQSNKNLIIQIEGHTNYSKTPAQLHQKLSKDRAEVIKKFLIENKIDENRISTIGYGYEKMLYPEAKTEVEMLLNRRVEIKIIKY